MDEILNQNRPNFLLNKNRWQKQWRTIQAAIQQLSKRKVARNEDLYRPLIDKDKIDGLINGCYSCLKVAGSNYTSDSDSPPGSQEELMALIKVINVEHHLRAAKRHQTTVEDLSVFATAVVEYFLSGYFEVEFDQEILDKNLRRLHVDFAEHPMRKEPKEKDKNDPKDFVIGNLLKQLSTDILHLQQTMHLRVAREDDEHHLSRQLTHTMAEVLARRALQLNPANIDSDKKSKLLNQFGEDLTILTYPRNGVRIRSVPYRNTLLIGFPITAFCDFEQPKGDNKLVHVTVSTAYLTLAHEVGHFVYRYGCPDINKPSETFEEIMKKKEIDEVAKPWLAELFSDVYSCMVEGPIAVIGFQEMLESEIRNSENETHHETHSEDESHADHVHPPALLRPFIFTQIIRRLAEKELKWQKDPWKVADMADMLDDKWREWLDDEGIPHPDPLDLTITLNCIITELRNAGMPIYQPDESFDLKSIMQSSDLPIALYNLYCLTCAKTFLEAYRHPDKEASNKLAWFKTQFEARKEDWTSRKPERVAISYVPDGGFKDWLMHDAWSDDGPTGGSSGRDQGV